MPSGNDYSDGGEEATDLHLIHDPYGGCVESCTHDLARGVLTDDICGGDGPYPSVFPLAASGPLAGLIAAART